MPGTFPASSGDEVETDILSADVSPAKTKQMVNRDKLVPLAHRLLTHACGFLWLSPADIINFRQGDSIYTINWLYAARC